MPCQSAVSAVEPGLPTGAIRPYAPQLWAPNGWQPAPAGRRGQGNSEQFVRRSGWKTDRDQRRRCQRSLDLVSAVPRFSLGNPPGSASSHADMAGTDCIGSFPVGLPSLDELPLTLLADRAPCAAPALLRCRHATAIAASMNPAGRRTRLGIHFLCSRRHRRATDASSYFLCHCAPTSKGNSTPAKNSGRPASKSCRTARPNSRHGSERIRSGSGEPVEPGTLSQASHYARLFAAGASACRIFL